MARTREWFHINSQKEHWTALTWAIFASLVLSFAGLLWAITGKGPAWWKFVTLCMQGTIQQGETTLEREMKDPYHRPRDRNFLAPFLLGIAAFCGPFILAMIPSLLILLGIMKLANPQSDDSG